MDSLKHLKSFQKKQIKNFYYSSNALNIMYNINIPSQGYPPNGKQMRPSTPLLSLFLNLQLSVGVVFPTP
jgi:hypothetical protein